MRNLTIAFALTLFAGSAAAQQANIDARILALARNWDHVNYETQGSAKVEQAAALGGQADALARQYPTRAEPLVWKGIALSTEAGAKGGLGALDLAKEAKAAFESAQKLNPQNAATQTSLGTLYAQVPGFPIGFGDKAKARTYLQKGLALDPQGLDANYFWADFLFRQGLYADAEHALTKALAAPARQGREIGDRGRRAEATHLLAQVRTKLGH